MEQQTLVAVVDDELSVRKAVSRLLRVYGFETEAFESARSFLDSLQQRKPDCVLIDIRMPEMNGLELCQRLTASDSGIPIVFITAHDEDALRQQGLPCSAFPCLRKPFSDEALIAAIGAALGRQPAAPSPACNAQPAPAPDKPRALRALDAICPRTCHSVFLGHQPA